MSNESHVQGSMDIAVQEKTFDGFVKFTARAAMVCIVALVFIALVNG